MNETCEERNFLVVSFPFQHFANFPQFAHDTVELGPLELIKQVRQQGAAPDTHTGTHGIKTTHKGDMNMYCNFL